MLHGSLAKGLVAFALPLAATGILQQLFNAADVAVVGRFAEESVRVNAQAAVGANTTVVSLFLNFFIGLSLGAGVYISSAVGRGDMKRVRMGVHTAILLGLIAGGTVAIAGQFLARPILRLMDVPKEVLDMAVTYLRIYLAGMPVILLYNFEAAVLRSVGDTRTPLYSLLFSGTANVLLNLLFVVGFHMTAGGVALATVISNAVSAVYLLLRLLFTDLPVRLDPKALRIDRRTALGILKLGAPAGLQSMVFALSNAMVQSGVNSLGPVVMAANVAAYNIEIIAYHLVNAFGQAATTFIGQNYGAGNPERCRKVTKTALLIAGGVALLCIAVLVPLARFILGFFNEDPDVVDSGLIRVKLLLCPYLLMVMMEVFSGSIRGYGVSLTPAIITVAVVCGTRSLWSQWLFPLRPTYAWLMTCYPVSWALDALALLTAYLLLLRRMARRSAPQETKTT